MHSMSNTSPFYDFFPQYKTFKAISALAAAQSPSRSSQK